MARKYTIYRVLLPNSNKGFTLLELLSGLVILSIVGGLALNALVQNSTSFNKDKKNIDVSQNLSAVLEIIGNDVRQAGEGILDPRFPAIEFSSNPAGFNSSSRITVRRAVSAPLTLCEPIGVGTTKSTIATIIATPLIIADSTQTNAGCNIGTVSSSLVVARPGTSYFYNSTTPPITTTPATIPSPALAPLLPLSLRQARDYRCQLSEPNPAIPYTAPSQATTDFCGGTPAQIALQFSRIAVSDGRGRILIFRQTGENISTVNATTPPTQASINIDTSFPNPSDPALANNSQNINATALPLTTTSYVVGSPIYLIEERTYTLIPDPNNSSSGILTLSTNGSAPQRLIKGIANFNVAARLYTDALAQSVDATPATLVTAGAAKNSPPKTTLSVLAGDICPNLPATTPLPTTPLPSDPQYVCKFNYNAALTDNTMNWKTIAGVKVSLQAKYDANGQSATASNTDLEKLRAQAEYFPRNVLSK